jgi:hypothetical protein
MQVSHWCSRVTAKNVLPARGQISLQQITFLAANPVLLAAGRMIRDDPFHATDVHLVRLARVQQPHAQRAQEGILPARPTCQRVKHAGQACTKRNRGRPAAGHVAMVGTLRLLGCLRPALNARQDFTRANSVRLRATSASQANLQMPWNRMHVVSAPAVALQIRSVGTRRVTSAPPDGTRTR